MIIFLFLSLWIVNVYTQRPNSTVRPHLGCLDDCASFGFVCDSSTGFCVQCLSALQCSPPTPACDPVNNACVQCNTDSSCNATSRCVNHVCVATLAPTKAPTIAPTNPTPAPTQTPTVAPTASPTTAPTPVPTTAPTVSPTVEPTVSPTNAPTPNPTISPTITPTVAPTNTPTQTPTTSPTVTPTSTPTTAPTQTPPQVTCTSDTNCNQFSYCDMTINECRLVNCSNLASCGGAGCLAGICGISNHACMCGNCFNVARVLPCTTNAQCFPCSDVICSGTPTCNGTGFCESIPFTCDPYNGDCQIPGLPICAQTRAPTVTPPQVTVCTSDPDCNQFSYCDMTTRVCRLLGCSNLTLCGGAGCLAGICGLANHSCMCGNCFDTTRVLPCTDNSECFPCSDAVCLGTPTCNGMGYCESITFTCDPYNGDCQIPGLPVCKTGIIIKSNDALGSIGIVLGIVILVVMGTVLIIFKLRRDGTTFNRNSFGNSYRNRIPLKQYHRV